MSVTTLGSSLGEAHAALEVPDALPAPDAHATLTVLRKRRGLASSRTPASSS